MTEPRKLFDKLFEFFQRRCAHTGTVYADISQGAIGGGDTCIQWCLRCGAYRHVYADSPYRAQEWQPPLATWARKP